MKHSSSSVSAPIAPQAALEDERQFLDAVGETYTITASPFMQALRAFALRVIAPHANGGAGLEVGSADGSMTALLAGIVDQLDVVDGSERFLEQVRRRNLPNVRCLHALLEEFAPEKEYDSIFALFVLEHVIDPVTCLQRMRAMLARRGTLFVVAPNARALSRQLARQMGLLNGLEDLTENDHRHGHRRVYDRTRLNRDLADAGLEPIAEGGLLLKLLADFQMDQLIREGVISGAHLEGLYRLGLEYPDFSAALFSICRPR